MIFYFSGAGNSHFIASLLAKKLDMPLVSITESLKSKKTSFDIERDSSVGFVFPIHFWGVPHIVIEFIREMHLKMNENTYTWVVFTCGGSTGNAEKIIKKELKQKNIKLFSSFSIRMTDIFVPFFQIPDKETINKNTEIAVQNVESIAYYINNKEKGDFNKNKGQFHNFTTFFLYPLYKYYRGTSKFRVEENCTACRKCEMVCPTNTIEMINNKPVWKKNKCTLCFACLHTCPVQAINYGKVLFFWDSKGKGRYKNTFVIK